MRFYSGVGSFDFGLVRRAEGHVEKQERNECEQKQNVKAELVKHDANSKRCKIRGVNYSG
jgi:hypothetical protein